MSEWTNKEVGVCEEKDECNTHARTHSKKSLKAGVNPASLNLL